MVNLGRPSLPPNRPYHQPFNYFEYVKAFDPYVRVKFFKSTIKANGEIEDAKIVNLFSFTLENTIFDWCNNYMGNCPNYIFVELQLTFCK
jgi:hypothetical protein